MRKTGIGLITYRVRTYENLSRISRTSDKWQDGRIQRGGRDARLKVLQRMPRIHSWREVIAPRDCRCIVHRATLHPAAGSSTGTAGTSSSLEPPSSPTRFPPPLTPPSRNEQRAISLLLNACHKSPRAPSRSFLLPPIPISSTSYPVEALSLVSPLLPPEDSTLACTTPRLLSHFLNFSPLCFIAFILRISFVPFSPYFAFSSIAFIDKRKKTKNA